MDKIKIHTEKKCRPILTPAADFSPQIQHWYGIIHSHLALLRLKEGNHKHMNEGNVYREARRKKENN